MYNWIFRNPPADPEQARKWRFLNAALPGLSLLSIAAGLLLIGLGGPLFGAVALFAGLVYLILLAWNRRGVPDVAAHGLIGFLLVIVAVTTVFGGQGAFSAAILPLLFVLPILLAGVLLSWRHVGGVTLIAVGTLVALYWVGTPQLAPARTAAASDLAIATAMLGVVLSAVGIGAAIYSAQITRTLRELAASQGQLAAQNTTLRERTTALAQLQRDHALLLAAAGEGIFGVDRAGQATFVNPAAVHLLGRSAADLTGQILHDLIHHTRAGGTPCSAADCPLAAAWHTGNVYHNPADRFWHPDGSAFPVEYTSTPLRDAAGSVVGAVVCFHDITSHNATEALLREQAQLAALNATIGEHLSRPAPLEILFQQTAEAIVQHLDTTFARIWTLNAATNVLELEASAGLYTHRDGPHGRVPVGQFKIGRIAATRQAHLSNDIATDPAIGDPAWAAREGLVAFAGYPLLVEGRVVGVLATFARHALSPAAQSTLATVAERVAQVIERKHAEAAQARLLAILEATTDFVGICDLAGRLLYMNQAARRLLELDPAVDIGEQTIAAYHPPWAAELVHDAAIPTALRTGVWEGESALLTRTGRAIPVSQVILAHRSPDGTAEYLSTVIRDIRPHKRAEEALAAARETAEAANRAKSLFLANMSHELRTPLNAVIGYSDLLLHDARADNKAGLVSDLEKIRASGEHLLHLINDILDLSRIEAGKMPLAVEPFAVVGLLDIIQTTVAPLIARNANTLRVEVAGDPGTMEADPSRLRQVLLNLLSNAAKFTKDGTITLAVARTPMPSGDELRFTVRDTGIGMSAEQLGRLFQEFSQAERTTTRQYGGTGLGLALSRRLCRLMGGDITVESAPGAGSTFTIWLPAAPPPVAPPAAAATPPALPAAPGDVLVIDDDPAVRDLLTRYLTGEGFAVRTAAAGAAGLALARARRPALIILDVLLPGADGWTVLGALKADPVLAAIPVVMATILDDPTQGFTLGAADYLTKPVERARLLEVVGRYGAPAGGQGEILVVEDDAATRALIARTLAEAGWTVREAADGRTGLDAVAARRPDLVLLDLMMPEIDGFGVVAALRAAPQTRAIPIVVLTALDVSRVEREQLEGAVQRIVQKGATGRTEVLREVGALIREQLHQEAPGPGPANHA